MLASLVSVIRIISGAYRRRLLRTPADASTVRPLPDRVRTAVFNMLAGHLDGAAVFDGFAGVGSFGLEAASRGAATVLMIERDREIARLLEENVRTLGAGDACRVVRGDVLGLSALARCPRPVHVVFFDPPYPMVVDPASRARVFGQLARLVELLDDDGFAILRTPWPFREPRREDEPEAPTEEVDLAIPGAVGPETHAYGSTAVHWYARASSGSGGGR